MAFAVLQGVKVGLVRVFRKQQQGRKHGFRATCLRAEDDDGLLTMAALAKRIGAYDEAECKSQLDAAAHVLVTACDSVPRGEGRATTVPQSVSKLVDRGFYTPWKPRTDLRKRFCDLPARMPR